MTVEKQKGDLKIWVTNPETGETYLTTGFFCGRCIWPLSNEAEIKRGLHFTCELTDWKATSRKWEKRSTKYRAAILQIEADLNSGRISSALSRIQNVRSQIEADIPSPVWNPFQEPTQSQTQKLESEKTHE